MNKGKRKVVKLEEVLSSRGRVRILGILVKLGELNISEIARRAKLNYTTTNQHLLALEAVGLIREKRFGRIRIYEFQKKDPKAQAIKSLIDFWEEVA